MGATFGFSRPQKRMLINARSETIGQRPTFRRLLDRGRALIPMNAFYESGPTGSFIFQGTTTPSLLLAAGLVDVVSRSFVILTQDANDVVAQVHGRMPVLMTIDTARSWLAEGALGHVTIDLDSQPVAKTRTEANTPARRRGQTRTASGQLDEALPGFEQGRLE
jgi:putative SOS response-associated peptidase YedK